MSAKELLTADEAAKLLKIARRTLLRWARERKIESVHVSRKVVLFTAEAIEAFLKRRTIGAELPVSFQPTPEIRSVERQPKPRGKKASSTQSWKELRKEVMSWAKKGTDSED